MSWKKSLLVMRKILELFVNKLTADDKYSLLKCGNLTQPIHMQLSKKENTFSDLFFPFLKNRLNFEHFEKNINLIASVIHEITDSERRS